MLSKVKKDIIILAIESSCDDTAVSISRNNNLLGVIFFTDLILLIY